MWRLDRRCWCHTKHCCTSCTSFAALVEMAHCSTVVTSSCGRTCVSWVAFLVPTFGCCTRREYFCLARWYKFQLQKQEWSPFEAGGSFNCHYLLSEHRQFFAKCSLDKLSHSSQSPLWKVLRGWPLSPQPDEETGGVYSACWWTQTSVVLTFLLTIHLIALYVFRKKMSVSQPC